MKNLFRQLVAAVLCTCALPAQGLPVMNLDTETLIRGAVLIKDSLELTPNQQILWQQVASKSASVLRARQARREKLDAAFKAQLQSTEFELRNLTGPMDREAADSEQESAQLRDLWLTMNDALDDRQRRTVNQFLLSQLERNDSPARSLGASGREPPPAGQRRQKPGGEMGGRRF